MSNSRNFLSFYAKVYFTKGNEEQAGFNEKLEDVVTEAQAHLSGDGSPPAIDPDQGYETALRSPEAN